MFRSTTRTDRTAAKPRTLALEVLEAREVPAVTIQFDYSFDTSGFFNDPARRATLEQVGRDIGSQLSAPLAPIVPAGGSTWTASFINPSTGAQSTIDNPVIPGNMIVVFVGGRALGGGEAGQGGNGGYSGSGWGNWLDTLRSRGSSGFSLWGGSLAFDTGGTNFYTGSDLAGIGRNQVDFYSVVSHELGHVLGIGTARQWFGGVAGGAFVGPTAESLYGGPVPVYGDGSHWADGLTYNGQRASMNPVLPLGTRVGFTPLDYAALVDIGWGLDFSGSTPPASPPVSPPPVSPLPASPPPPVSPPPVATPVPSNPSSVGTTKSETVPSASHDNGGLLGRVVLTGAGGMAQGFNQGPGGQLSAAGGAFQPFPGFTGAIRSVVADFNGDGVLDAAFGTGAGTAARVRVIDGATGGDLAGATPVLDGFGGGVYVAAGDVDRDGRAELAVSADAGGGTRVMAFQVAGGLKPMADFMAFGDAAFRGGSRVAMGDVNRDGAADLIVGAGLGGGPRVAIYNGGTLFSGSPASLVPDFFALDPSLRSGVFVTSADLDGDGYSDVIYSTGNTGGPRVRVVGGATLTNNPGQDAYYLPAVADFFALDSADRTGLRIAAHDLNGDGKAELVVANGNAASPQVRVISLADMQSPTGPATPYLNPLPGPTADGVYVG